MWWSMPIISALRRLRQAEHQEPDASLVYSHMMSQQNKPRKKGLEKEKDLGTLAIEDSKF